MSKKQTQTNSNPHDSVQRPRVLGWLILAAGGFSAWYWYKPLPPEAGQAAYSNWDHQVSGSSPWSDTSLIRPSLEDFEGTEFDGAIPSNSTRANGMQEPWAGASKHGLIPVPNQTSSLADILSAEPQPSIPEISTGVPSIETSAKPWVEGFDQAGSITGLHSNRDRKSTEITTAPWPDKTYRSQQVIAESVHPAAIPPLLNQSQQHLASSRIRTQESDAERARQNPIEPNPTSPSVPPPNRSPLFIRQPKK